MVAVRGHRRDAATKFSHLSRLQDRELILDLGSSRTKNLDVERRVLDIEVGSERLHVEETRRFLEDAPEQAALAGAHVHGGVHDPNHW